MPSVSVAQGPRRIPQHVAIIMDGNGRWAARRGLPRVAGHQAGVRNIRPILESCVERGVQILTLYAFSTENWRRPPSEVSALLQLMRRAIREETRQLHENGVRVRHLGRTDGLPPDLCREIAQATALTDGNSRITLNVAFNYGGRIEILDAVRQLMRDGVSEDALDEELFSRYLTTEGQADPDLIIRSGGEMRLSNFLLWQAAYAEYYATSTFWPDFGAADLDLAIEEFAARERRYGRVAAG